MAKTDMTYDPEADAAYIYLGRGKIDRQEETGPFTYDVDAEGRIIGIEILSASKSWRRANGRLRGSRARQDRTLRSK
jgi:uncharacterized protein YuzE